jgi:NADH dehydrogenase FAD-containing subunit
VELAGIAAEHGVRLTRDALELVDADRHEVLTQGGARRSYDVLVLALGTRPALAVQGAMAFRGYQDLMTLTAALDTVTSVAYIASSTSMWAAPLYEVAVQTAAWAAHRRKVLDVLVITAGRVAESLSARLEDAGVEVVAEAVADRFSGGLLDLADGRRVAVGLAVALPHLTGPIVRGLPARSRDGFTVVDESGHVAGLTDVYAVGDMTDRRVLAAEQAGAAAGAITAD